ncbi:MAG: DUF2795 domain-containing protein [Dehalococcoidales bacterium]
MKNYKIGENGKLILISEVGSDSGVSNVRIREFYPLESPVKSQLEASSRKTAIDSQLKEAFRRMHPEWTERELEIAVTGEWRESNPVIGDPGAGAKPKILTVGDIQMLIAKLKYPCVKAQILDCAKAANAPPEAIRSLERITDEKPYNTLQEVIVALQVR